MKYTFVFILLNIVCIAGANVCENRQSIIAKNIETQLQKKCDDISIEDLKHILELDLENNEIESISAQDLDGLVALEYLNLNYNKIKTLPEDLLLNLPMLEYFYFRGNQIRELPESIFRPSKFLHSIDLRDNDLISIPKTVFHGLDELFYLRLSHNVNLKTLPETMLSGTSLELFSCQNCGLSTLPKDFFENLTNAESIYINNNSLTEVPEANFEFLSNLFLGYNSLTKIPKVTGEIDVLDLKSNPIKELSSKDFPESLKTEEIILDDLKLKVFNEDAFVHLKVEANERIKISLKNNNIISQFQDQLNKVYKEKIKFDF